MQQTVEIKGKTYRVVTHQQSDTVELYMLRGVKGALYCLKRSLRQPNFWALMDLKGNGLWMGTECPIS